uniref:Uncharacterized protein n=1 Tax=Sclerotinia borealis TaxID=77105 RepID=A0A088CRV9_9HELO|nr:hypothetical protein SBORM_0123 [Sclerotinia borealis]AIJ56815.1 hypothetical protein SBORM_0123 [Sclerotinia borealis]
MNIKTKSWYRLPLKKIGGFFLARVDLDLLKVNRKNKPILVKGKNFEQNFESITDTIKFFNTLNIKLDRKTLYIRLKWLPSPLIPIDPHSTPTSGDRGKGKGEEEKYIKIIILLINN